MGRVKIVERRTRLEMILNVTFGERRTIK